MYPSKIDIERVLLYFIGLLSPTLNAKVFYKLKMF